MNDDGAIAGTERARRAVRAHDARDGRLPPHRASSSPSSTTHDWKSVGDVAYVDDEGYVYICDRKKDMIISGGVNIYPAEIEAVLYAHPQVLDAAVFGIPDDEWGERVHAIVQAEAGRDDRPRRAARVRRAAPRARTSARATTSCATSCRAPTPASCSSACCATSTGQDHDRAGLTAIGRATAAVRYPPARADAVRSRFQAAAARATACRCSTSASAPTPTRAVAAADALGFPVVVKLCGDAIAHKTERGLVRLGLRDADARARRGDRAARRGPARRRRGRAARRADGARHPRADRRARARPAVRPVRDARRRRRARRGDRRRRVPPRAARRTSTPTS